MSKIFSNLFSRRSNKLQTDAGVIPQQQNEQQVDDSEDEEQQQQQQCQYQTDLMRNNSQSDSIPPLKQHILAVEEISQRNQIVEYPQGNNSLMQPNLNNNLVGTSPGTVNNTVFQFSHIQGLHIGSVNYNSQTSVNSDNSQQQNGRSSIDNKKRIRSGDVKKTRTIDDMMKSSDTMDHPLMELISTHLGEDWRMVIRDLGFSNAQLAQFQEDNIYKGVKETIYQCLLDWSRNDETACLGKISRLLWKKGHKETVYFLKEYWKTVRSPEIELVGKKI